MGLKDWWRRTMGRARIADAESRIPSPGPVVSDGVGRAARGKGDSVPALPHWVPIWASGRPSAWSDDPAEQVAHYKHWVYSAVNAIAFRCAMVNLRLYAASGTAGRGAGTREGRRELTSHPFLDLLDYVNPFHTRFWLWSTTLTFLELTGNAYWYVVRNGLGTPVELWLIHSQFVRVIPDRERFIAGYEYRRGSEVVRFEPGEIVHLKYPNPESLFYGRGPLQAAAEAVDTHEAIKSAEVSSFRKGAFPGLAISTGEELSEATVERLRRGIEAFYSGAENAGKVIVLERGLQAAPITLTPREMDFLHSSRLTRDEILGIFKVPAAIAGLSENVNRAVAEAMDVIFARYCIAPRLRLIEDQLNQDLLPMFDEGLVCRFEDVVPEDREQRRADLELDLKYGVRTVNEVRETERGLPPVEWGDRPRES